MGVGHLDPDDVPALLEGQGEGEVPSRDTAVKNGVRSEFGDDEDDAVVRLGPSGVPLLGELVRGEQPGEAGTAPGGGETLRERAYGGGGSAVQGWHAGQPADS